jgi:hypothetical protein
MGLVAAPFVSKGSFGKPSPPSTPDYAGAAQAQGAANVDAAVASSNLNNPNVITPYGSQTYTPGATSTDRPTLTQTMSPGQQQLYDQGLNTQMQLGSLGQQGTQALQGVVGKPVSFDSAPQAGSYDDTRKRVMDAYMGRADEDYGKQTDQTNSDLVAAGIRPGSKAYADRMQMIERSHNDARNQAEIAGGNAASQAYGMDADRRKQAITEYLAQRQVPLNEITALLSGSQVTNPFSAPGYSQNSNMAPAPTYQATTDQGNFASDLYNVKAAQNAQLVNGLFQMGSSAIKAGGSASDRRLKSNVVRIGTHPLGIGTYEYDIFGQRERGVMAQELQTVMPEAVSTHPTEGYLMVHYDMIGGRPS